MVNLQKGLIGHWTMNDRDTSSGIIRDASAHCNHGVIEGNPGTGIEGVVGEAYDLSDEGDAVRVHNEEILNISHKLTLTAWIKIESADPDFNGGISKGYIFSGSGGYSYRIQIHNDGLRAEVSDGDNRYLTSRFYMDLDNWYHVALVYDGSEVLLYIDGEEFDSTSFEEELAFVSDDFYIGSKQDDRPLVGNTEEVRLYNRALSEKEIKALYNVHNKRVRSV